MDPSLGSESSEPWSDMAGRAYPGLRAKRHTREPKLAELLKIRANMGDGFRLMDRVF